MELDALFVLYTVLTRRQGRRVVESRQFKQSKKGLNPTQPNRYTQDSIELIVYYWAWFRFAYEYRVVQALNF